MRGWLLMAVTVVLTACAAHPIGRPSRVPTRPLNGWAGRYVCAGTDRDGSRYELPLLIAATGKVYQVAWNVVGDRAQAIGVGLPSDDGAILMVGFVTGQYVGVIVYRHEAAGLAGRYAVWGSGATAQERCRLKAHGRVAHG